MCCTFSAHAWPLQSNKCYSARKQQKHCSLFLTFCECPAKIECRHDVCMGEESDIRIKMLWKGICACVRERDWMSELNCAQSTVMGHIYEYLWISCGIIKWFELNWIEYQVQTNWTIYSLKAYSSVNHTGSPGSGFSLVLTSHRSGHQHRSQRH